MPAFFDEGQVNRVSLIKIVSIEVPQAYAQGAVVTIVNDRAFGGVCGSAHEALINRLDGRKGLCSLEEQIPVLLR